MYVYTYIPGIAAATPEEHQTGQTVVALQSRIILVRGRKYKDRLIVLVVTAV